MTDPTARDDRTFIGETYRHRLTTQQYGSKPDIQAAVLLDLPVASDEGGDFCELARFPQGGGLASLPEFQPAQLSYSSILPGTIKAWHVHEHQDDVWFVPPSGRLLIGLLDVRGDSPTFRNSMRFVGGAGRARLLFIPQGVAHGVANLSQDTASIIYLANRAFNPDEPDEHRLPFDILGPGFWTIPPG
jgi:dTDP-4-dehydrorhamnose 3,5-epimerase